MTEKQRGIRGSWQLHELSCYHVSGWIDNKSRAQYSSRDKQESSQKFCNRESARSIQLNNQVWYKNKYSVVIAFLKEIHVRKVEADELITAKQADLEILTAIS